MLQEFDRKVFNILFLRALPGLSVRQVGEAFGTLADISGAKKWEGAETCPNILSRLESLRF